MVYLYTQLRVLRQRMAAQAGECYKKPYVSETEAVAFARLLRGPVQRAYWCFRCGFWHLTTRDQSRDK